MEAKPVFKSRATQIGISDAIGFLGDLLFTHLVLSRLSCPLHPGDMAGIGTRSQQTTLRKTNSSIICWLVAKLVRFGLIPLWFHLTICWRGPQLVSWQFQAVLELEATRARLACAHAGSSIGTPTCDSSSRLVGILGNWYLRDSKVLADAGPADWTPTFDSNVLEAAVPWNRGSLAALQIFVQRQGS